MITALPPFTAATPAVQARYLTTADGNPLLLASGARLLYDQAPAPVFLRGVPLVSDPLLPLLDPPPVPSLCRLTSLDGLGWMQLMDTVTGSWLTLWLEDGQLQLGVGELAGQPGVRSQAGYLQLWDTVTVAWRPVWLFASAFVAGMPDWSPTLNAPAVAWRVQQDAADGEFELQLFDLANQRFRVVFIYNWSFAASPVLPPS